MTALLVLKQLGIMLLLIFTGAMCFKKKILDRETTKKMAKFLLVVVNSSVIITAYQQDFSASLLKGLLWTMLLSVISFTASIILSFFLVRTKNCDDSAVERFSMIYSNCGFMGIPLVQCILGADGVIYITAYLTIFNILVWSHGVMLYSNSEKGSIISGIKKAFTAPTCIATFVGFIFFVLKIRLHEIPLTALEYLSSMNTPLAMVVSGSTIAGAGIIHALKRPSVYFISFLKLILVPIVTIILVYFIPAPREAVQTVIIASACPSATTGTLFALTFNRNSEYASQIFSISTLLCAVTIPLIMLLC